jgi:hypothetical protein
MDEGKLLPAELRDIIGHSRLAVFFITQAAGQSSWVEFELEVARASQTRVRGVLIDAGAQPPGWFLPSELIRLQCPMTEEGAAVQVCSEVLRILDSLGRFD